MARHLEMLSGRGRVMCAAHGHREEITPEEVVAATMRLHHQVAYQVAYQVAVSLQHLVGPHWVGK